MDGDGTTLTPADTDNTDAAGEGTAQNSFLNSLPETLRGNEQLSKYESAEQLAQAHLEAIGKIPKVPESHDLYEIAIPEGMPVNKDRIQKFKEFAHAINLTQDQVKRIVDHELETTKEVMAQAEQGKKERESKVTAFRDKQINELKTEWGVSFDANLETAKTALRTFGDENLVKFINDSRLGDHPVFIKFMHKLGKSISEDAFIDGKAGAPHKDRQRTSTGMLELDFPNTPNMA